MGFLEVRSDFILSFNYYVKLPRYTVQYTVLGERLHYLKLFMYCIVPRFPLHFMLLYNVYPRILGQCKLFVFAPLFKTKE